MSEHFVEISEVLKNLGLTMSLSSVFQIIAVYGDDLLDMARIYFSLGCVDETGILVFFFLWSAPNYHN
jgi:hypothetical protein